MIVAGKNMIPATGVSSQNRSVSSPPPSQEVVQVILVCDNNVVGIFCLCVVVGVVNTLKINTRAYNSFMQNGLIIQLNLDRIMPTF